MSRRRGKRVDAVNESRPHPPLSSQDSSAPPPVPANTNRRPNPSSPAPANTNRRPNPSSPAPANANRRPQPPSHLPDAFKEIVERAADKIRNDLASTGKIRPTAFFVYPDGTMKAVSLSFKDELHKELLIRRIREKALAENASEVLTLTEAEHERHAINVLSGVTTGVNVSARLDYSYDKETKTVTSWRLSWLNRPVQNVFLDGIFGKTG